MRNRNGMGFNWNSLYPFPLYNQPPVVYTVPPVQPLPPSPAYNFPVIQEPAVVPAPATVSPWLVVGGGVLAGLVIGSLIS